MRTIKAGRVRIGGRTFIPSSQFVAYDGRLDGKRYLFGRYWNGDHELDTVCLWGPEAVANANPDDPAYELIPRPEVVDGMLPWLWWDASA